MATADDVLRIAAAEIGYKENPPNSNRTKYGKWYGLDGNPWCAMFLSWCFWQAGMPLHIQTPKGFHYTSTGYEWFKAHGALHQTPQRGDLVFFDFPGGHARVEHVGIVESVGNGYIVTIEGNTSGSNNTNGGMVQRRNRALNSSVKGFGRPAYTQTKTGGSFMGVSNIPVFLVYKGSPEAAFLYNYRFGAKGIGPTGVRYAQYGVLEFDKQGSPPTNFPAGSFGVGTNVPGWAQITGKDRYDTLKKLKVHIDLDI
jgi:hypothetical protein